MEGNEPRSGAAQPPDARPGRPAQPFVPPRLLSQMSGAQTPSQQAILQQYFAAAQQQNLNLQGGISGLSLAELAASTPLQGPVSPLLTGQALAQTSPDPLALLRALMGGQQTQQIQVGSSPAIYNAPTDPSAAVGGHPLAAAIPVSPPALQPDTTPVQARPGGKKRPAQAVIPTQPDQLSR